MRSSVLSRSVIAVATLAIGSVALAAVPATAATAGGVTREAVLSLAAATRADAGLGGPPSVATKAAALDVLKRSCNLTTGEVMTSETPIAIFAVTPSANVDGVYLSGTVTNLGTGTRKCAVGAVAPSDAASTLTGTGTLSLTTTLVTTAPAQSTLSGDVAITVLPNVFVDSTISTFSYTASGATIKPVTTTTTTTVKDTKSKAEKKAAKKKYVKRLANAKKKYVKALKKAGNSKSKKAVAKKAYNAAKISAKAKYKKAISGTKSVTTTTVANESRSFEAKASNS